MNGIGHSDVATTLRYYVDACPADGGVFPEDLKRRQRCWRKGKGKICEN
ncbi:MAG: hypothetical protein AABY26_02750 [Nanoarchaeota archaeon]